MSSQELEKQTETLKEEVEQKEAKEEKRERKRGLRKKIKLYEEKLKGDGERILTVRFFPGITSAPRWKWAKKAVSILREKILKHCKQFEDPTTGKKIRPKEREVWISPELNAIIWSRGSKNPLRTIRVKIVYKFLDDEKKSVELRVFPAV